MWTLVGGFTASNRLSRCVPSAPAPLPPTDIFSPRSHLDFNTRRRHLRNTRSENGFAISRIQQCHLVGPCASCLLAESRPPCDGPSRLSTQLSMLKRLPYLEMGYIGRFFSAERGRLRESAGRQARSRAKACLCLVSRVSQ